MPAADPRDTPAMRQYARFKQRHPDCLLLFRIGDFYELFDDDALRASKALGLTLTQRTEGIPMCGLPFHQLENYLRRALGQGLRVAVCEQVQDAAEAKGIVERAVTRVLTPGTLVDQSLLEEERSANLAAVAFLGAAERGGKRNGHAGRGGAASAGDYAAIAVVELATGAFSVALVPAEGPALVDELTRRQVSEVLYAEAPQVGWSANGTVNGAGRGAAHGSAHGAENGSAKDRGVLASIGAAGRSPRVGRLLTALGVSGTPQPQWHFRREEALEALRQQFGVATFEGFGFQETDPELIAAGVIVRYLRATQTPDGEAAAARGRPTLKHLQPPKRELAGDRLILDAASLRALEIDRTIRTGALEGSLLGVFLGPGQKGACRTGMGKRLLREWLVRPSARLEVIEGRHAAVAALVGDRGLAARLGAALEPVQDVPRIAARLALGRATPRDLVALGKSLGACAGLREVAEGTAALAGHGARLGAVEARVRPVAERIVSACVEAPPAHLREGGLIRGGVDAGLDEARGLMAGAEAWLEAYQAELVAKHGLPSLKVAFNKVFGFYIELPRAQAARAPAEFSRRQALTSAERFITPELKAYEERVQTAEGRALEREQALFAELCGVAAGALGALQAYAEVVAELDVLLCFAEKAGARGWCRPVMTDAAGLHVEQGRHPVLDEVLGADFVPNDLGLGPRAGGGGGGGEASPRLALITGPNMAGKSTFIRQTALLVLLAHAGSFVPAKAAEIGLTDRIFTRVGADDALHAGQSTFMVEMTETANILHHATERSVVVLDEIGRGTSTLDGLSLAWAIAERLAGGREARDQGSEGARDQGSEDLVPRSLGASIPSPRTLFATHYHELTRLEEALPGRVANLHVAVREWPAAGGQGDEPARDDIVFLHRILPGRTDKSYGIHVAQLAGLPVETVRRAREVMESLSVRQAGEGEGAVDASGPGDASEPGDAAAGRGPARAADGQMGLFTEFVPHPAVEALRGVKMETMTPLQAFDELRRLKGMVGE